MKKKLLLIDRDGTLIQEPFDEQVDNIEKLSLMPTVITSLLRLKSMGYIFVIVSNQDGLGTEKFPEKNFSDAHEFMLKIFSSQGITFDAVLICPHTTAMQCFCRKPQIGLMQSYLSDKSIDWSHTYMIGDRETDMIFAKNLNIPGFRIGSPGFSDWRAIVEKIIDQDRAVQFTRKTTETTVNISMNLNRTEKVSINTSIGFFDHMLEQLAKHAGFELQLNAQGDNWVDEHHLVEDVAISLGEALRQALGQKRGIARYGFLLPMDDSSAQIALDLCDRHYFIFRGKFNRHYVGDFPTEMVSHFFRSFSAGLRANLHIRVWGENTHHQIEAIFKGVGRTLRQAIAEIETNIPSTKGVL